MADQPQPKAIDWIERIGELHPVTKIPGYWQNISASCDQWATEVTVGPFWKNATAKLDQWRTEYVATMEGDLLVAPGLPKFVGKSEVSIKDKVIRNCQKKGQFISEAIALGNAPVPQISDLVRTRIACRYIDGVEFLTSKLYELAQEMDLNPKRDREGRLEGYFAQHLTISHDVIYRFAGKPELTKVRCEVQVASEMATRMWEASHPVYEVVRGTASRPEDWQWAPNDPRFISNQLGHMIHLADGLLVQLRGLTAKGKK